MDLQVTSRGCNPPQLAKVGTPALPVLNLSETEKAEIGEMDEHAGFDETSRLMFLRPDVSTFLQSYRSQRDNALALAILDGKLTSVKYRATEKG